MSGAPHAPGSRRTRWWPVVAAAILSSCVTLDVRLLDAGGALSGLAAARERHDALEREVAEREVAARQRPEVEREVAMLAAQCAELERMVPRTREEALARLKHDLCRWGAWDLVVESEGWRPPTDGRPFGVIPLRVRARSGPMPGPALVVALLDHPPDDDPSLLVSVRGLAVRNLSDPDSPFTLDLEAYTHAP